MVTPEEFNSLPGRRKDLYSGYVYAVEFSDGTVKVGGTCNPQTRLKTLRTLAGKHGISLVSAYLESINKGFRQCELAAVKALSEKFEPAYGREWFSGIGIAVAAAEISKQLKV